LDLEKDTLDDEAFLRVCRQTGRLLDLVNRLLALKRVDEAAAEARLAEDYDLLRLADIFAAHKQADLVAGIIRERIQAERPAGERGPDTRLIEWLRKYAAEQGDSAQALILAERLFWLRPGLPGYEALEAAAQAGNKWQTVRGKTLSRLDAQKNYALLTEIYLKEGEVAQAIESVKQVKAGWWPGYGQSPLLIQVAQAAEKSHPRESIRIYLDAANRLIKGRGRENYVAAAGYFARVRKLYKGLGEVGTWRDLIADIREQNRSLRALKEELDKAGL
jgi:uncharacterized Zn finger protein